MTDIQGNYSINTYYNNVQADKKGGHCEDCSSKKEEKASKKIDLGKDPAAAVGRSMINHKRYQFNPEDVKSDAEEFQFDFALAKEFARDLIAEGCSPERAAEIAVQMMFCMK